MRAARFLTVMAAGLAAILSAAVPEKARAAEPGCKPDMAQAPAHGPVRIIPAQLKFDEARITYVGHSTFLIESARGLTAATDYNDYVRHPSTPTVATMNKAHSTHYSNNPDPAIRHVLPGWNPRGGAANHDITVDDLRVRNVPTNIRSFNGNTDFDGNSIFVFEVGELCIVHLGHLHHELEPGHLRAIGRADIVLAPVDGSYTLDMDGMLGVLKTLQPRIIIPMHFFGRATLERFLFKASGDWLVDTREAPVLTISRATLPRNPTVVVLPGR